MKSAIATLALLPIFASAEMHRMKLQKIPYAPDANERFSTDVAHLAIKYGGQIPMGGFGGSGRKVAGEAVKDDSLYWTQNQQDMFAKGGHGVPLGSQYPHAHPRSHPQSLTFLADFANAQYFADISIGSPPQNVCLPLPLCVPNTNP